MACSRSHESGKDLEQSFWFLEPLENYVQAGFARDTKEVKGAFIICLARQRLRNMELLWSAPDTNFEGKGIQVGESLSFSKINMYSALAQKI